MVFIRLKHFTGEFTSQGFELTEDLFVSSTFDRTPFDGPLTRPFEESFSLAAGRYSMTAGIAVNPLYFERFSDPTTGAQTVDLDLTLLFRPPLTVELTKNLIEAVMNLNLATGISNSLDAIHH